MKATASIFSISALLLLLFARPAHGQCVLTGGTLGFSSRSASLDAVSQTTLASLATQMRGGNCRVVISGTGGGNKWTEERSWARINTVIDYMVDHYNIDRVRFISRYIGNAPKDHISYRAAREDESGNSKEDEPHPGLLRK